MNIHEKTCFVQFDNEYSYQKEECFKEGSGWCDLCLFGSLYRNSSWEWMIYAWGGNYCWVDTAVIDIIRTKVVQVICFRYL